MGSASVGAGKSKAGGEMPAEMRQIITDFWQETGALRKTLQNQMLEALQTGGVGAQAPIIGRAEEAQRMQTSAALRGIDQQLAQQGLAGTPFGERIRAEELSRGRTTLAGIGPQYAAQFIGQVPGYTQAGAQSIMGSLAGTRETQAQAKSWT